MGMKLGLKGLKCNSCDEIYIPPKYICPCCGNQGLKEVGLNGTGKVFSFTTIRVPSLGFEDQGSYDIALIKLEEGINITARLVREKDKDIKIGERVKFLEYKNGVPYFELT